MQHYQIKPSVTDRSVESVKIHLKEISHFKVLTPEQEAELAFKMYQGDMEARDIIIKSNLRFVVSIAKQYQGKGIEFEDSLSTC